MRADVSEDGRPHGPAAPGTARTRRRDAVAFGLVLAAIIAAAGADSVWMTRPGPSRHVTAAAPRNVGVVPIRASDAAATYVWPDRIEIPRLHAVAPIADVATLVGGELDVPRDPKIVGWWRYGAKPGARTGTAIFDGHINYAGVDGALARIGTLDPGDLVYVYGQSNGRATRIKFAITGVRTYDKQALPYRQIFDQNSVGRLVLVTCGGPFDSATGNYVDNVVAFAVPA